MQQPHVTTESRIIGIGGPFSMIAILGLSALAALAAYVIGWEHAVLRLKPQIDRILEQSDP